MPSILRDAAVERQTQLPRPPAKHDPSDPDQGDCTIRRLGEKGLRKSTHFNYEASPGFRIADSITSRISVPIV